MRRSPSGRRIRTLCDTSPIIESMDALTQNQELYCQARMRGLTQRAAYREAYPRSVGWSDRAVDTEASKIERTPKISHRLAQLNAESARQAKITRAKLLARLDAIADKAEQSVEYEDCDGNRRIRPADAEVVIKATKELLPYAEDEDDERPSFVADFGLLIAPPFLRPHRLIAARAQIDYWFPGGRGSMKSSFASLEVVNDVEKHSDHNALVLMKYKANIRDSAYAQVVWAIEALGLSDEYDCPESTLRITKKSTGQVIIFRGCDNADKIKSIKVKVGYIAIAWYEEVDQFRGMAEIRKINQSITRGGHNFIRLYTFNPPRSRNCWVNSHIDELRENGTEVFASTYLDAPAEWLGGQFVADAEFLKETDGKAYEHEYMGIPVGLGGDVFDRVTFREVTDDEIRTFDNLRCGQDFGWYPDPWAFVMSEWQPGSRTIIAFFEDGGNKIQPNEQAERIIEAQTWADEPGAEPTYHHIPVLSDDAGSSYIAAQRDTGANARAAGKGNMRMASYQFVQSCILVIDPERCPRLAKEVREMQYEQNKDGEWLNSIPDGNDHWVDAVRYAYMREAKSRRAYRATQEEE